MQTFSNDKVLHFSVSAALVFAAYTAQTVHPCCIGRKWNHEDYRLFFAGAFSLTLGVLKEIMDAVSVKVDMPWCPCHFDVWDLLVNINGVTAALLLLVALEACRHPKAVAPPCDVTVTSEEDDMSLCHDGKEDDEDLETGHPEGIWQQPSDLPSASTSSNHCDDHDDPLMIIPRPFLRL